MAVLRLGKCFNSMPTIMYMAPDGITGFRPGTADNSPYTTLALACTDITQVTIQSSISYRPCKIFQSVKGHCIGSVNEKKTLAKHVGG